jgi:hypothetical protein
LEQFSRFLQTAFCHTAYRRPDKLDWVATPESGSDIKVGFSVVVIVVVVVVFCIITKQTAILFFFFWGGGGFATPSDYSFRSTTLLTGMTGISLHMQCAMETNGHSC